MQGWRSAIVESHSGSIRVRGYGILPLMEKKSFADMVFLLHRGHLPSPQESKLLDAILIGVADHGSGAPSCAAARLAASGNRQSLSAAVAAGVLAIGDEHGGAGSLCMEMIAEGLAAAKEGGLSIENAAARVFDNHRGKGLRLPGFGHRVHATDPRTAFLFDLAGQYKLAADGVRFLQALEKLIAQRLKPLPINIDGALAGVLHDLGFPPAFGKLVFIVGRVAGLSAEVQEEHEREKAMRIRIPVEYDGVPPREF